MNGMHDNWPSRMIDQPSPVKARCMLTDPAAGLADTAQVRRDRLLIGADVSLAAVCESKQGEPMNLTTPTATETSSGEEPKCWLCEGLGGVAIHNHWSEQRGKPLWTAHRLESASHPVRRCPECDLRAVIDELSHLRYRDRVVPLAIESALEIKRLRGSS